MKVLYIFAVLSVLFQFDSVCFSADSWEIKKSGEAFSITYSNGTYDYVSGKSKQNSIGRGYLMKSYNGYIGIFYDYKNKMREHRFIVMPADEGSLVNLIQSITRK